MLALLKIVEDKKEHSLREVIDTLTKHYSLSEQEQNELLSSGKQAVFDNRVGWARTYLKKAGLIISTRRGFFQITERGLNVLRQKPSKIDVKFLEQFEEFVRFRSLRHEKAKPSIEQDDDETTP
jgi:restriction system protein